ncbi:pyroglutamyl-peptidase I [Candidatus Xianfuyuplasma coldseepsis]|uniref:Pyroglutamyl-peptidase I n=1 Tax=Candidatus Xianfuyuplasma coldseepsis TaxID=2782163 RepID=A0A7L7KRZ1_9MOLU|nr:pyroglutamyl-peptidase I [Xianfuyuplasma coldseepsis]QMS84568.1 pyroglutamyl-peptidase I [Xianfuyuplasma coldseepsis]
MNIVITGFGSFLSNDQNPTKKILSMLPSSIDGHRVIPLELPVRFDTCFEPLKHAIDTVDPEIIIMLGLAGGRTAIAPERIAINRNDSKHPDNDGRKPQNQSIIESGENAYFSTLPIDSFVTELEAKDIPCKISNTAGLYVCNNVFYHTMHYLKQKSKLAKAGFIHVPFMDEQNKPKEAFSLPLETIYNGIMLCIKVTIRKEMGL